MAVEAVCSVCLEPSMRLPGGGFPAAPQGKSEHLSLSDKMVSSLKGGQNECWKSRVLFDRFYSLSS